MKFCSKCNLTKLISYFTNDQSTKDKLAHWCKSCRSESKKLRYVKKRQEGTWVYSGLIARKRALEILGLKCVGCDFSEIPALQIDHINGGGAQELRRDSNPQKVYRKIANGDTDGYQILCVNCNWIKRYENQEVVTGAQGRKGLWRQKRRTKALNTLGGKCSHCSFADARALQIDHVQGNGAQERKTISSDGLISKILQGEIEEYQILCGNCNWLKRSKNANENGGKPCQLLN